MPLTYSFTDQLAWSERYAKIATVDGVLMEYIPGATKVVKAEREQDRKGTDWWVYRACDRTISVDAKVRNEDWSVKPEPYKADDLALETWSVVERQVVGWTRNAKKQTDYILWLWTNTGRSCLVPFPMLCAVFSANLDDWCKKYRVCRQRTPDGYDGEYHSECVFVPRKVVWAAIYDRFSGIPARPQSKQANAS